MRFIIVGDWELPVSCATGLLDSGGEVCGMISRPRHLRPEISIDVAGFANSHDIPYYEVEDINSSESAVWMRERDPDYVIFMWHQIIKGEVLQIPRIYCIGTHPTALPFDRGRHPLHWLIALGITESKMSFFKMEATLDTGSILAQIPYRIASDDSIADVIHKVKTATSKGAMSLCQQLRRDPSFSGTGQDHALANYWRERTPHDVTIDLRMSSDMIQRTVRSFAPPYPCAKLVFESNVLLVVKASVADISNQMELDQFRRLEPGKIIYIDGSKIGVKVEDAILDLECMSAIPPDMIKGKYIHPPAKYIAGQPSLLAGL